MSNNNKEIVSAIELITPMIAIGYLEKNSTNRTCRPALVSEYKESMLRGEWVENGEGIIFSDDGRLLDGQHRLTAIVKSNIPQKMLVILNVSASAFDTINTGKPRTSTDVLKIGGINHPGIVASGVGNYIRFLEGSATSSKVAHRNPSNKRIREFIQERPEVVRYAESMAMLGRAGKHVIPSSSVCLSLYLAFVDHSSTDIADDFFNHLLYGNESMFNLYRQRRVNDKVTRRSCTTIELIALTIKVWNAWLRGESIKRISWAAMEDMPQIVFSRNTFRYKEIRSA